MQMHKHELEEFKAILEKQRKEVTSSKEAARKFLDSFGLLTPKGKLKRRYIVPQDKSGK